MESIKKYAEVAYYILTCFAILVSFFSVVISYFVIRSYLDAYDARWIFPDFSSARTIYIFMTFVIISGFFTAPLFVGFGEGYWAQNNNETVDLPTISAERKREVLKKFHKSGEKIKSMAVSLEEKMMKYSGAVATITVFSFVFLGVFSILVEKFPRHVQIWLNTSVSIILLIIIPFLYTQVQVNILKKSFLSTIKIYIPLFFINMMTYFFSIYIYFVVLSKSQFRNVAVLSVEGFAIIILLFAFPMLLNFFGFFLAATRPAYKEDFSNYYIRQTSLFIVLIIFSFIITLWAWHRANFSNAIMDDLGIGAFDAQLYFTPDLMKDDGIYKVAVNLGPNMYVKSLPDNHIDPSLITALTYLKEAKRDDKKALGKLRAGDTKKVKKPIRALLVNLKRLNELTTELNAKSQGNLQVYKKKYQDKLAIKTLKIVSRSNIVRMEQISK